MLAAIAAGKPCFCEKPLATEAYGARRIVEAEEAMGRRLVQVGFMRRYDRGYVALKETVRTRLGPPLMIHAAHRNPSVPGRYRTPMAIHDTLIHEIDVLRWLLDDEYVSAQVIFPRATRHTHAGLRDPQIVLLETAKGVRIDVEIFVNCRYGYDIQCEVVGEEGTARLPEPTAIPTRLGAVFGQPILMDWKDRFIDSYDVELQDFLKAAAQAPPPVPPPGTAMPQPSPQMSACRRRRGPAPSSPSPCRPARPSMRKGSSCGSPQAGLRRHGVSPS